MVHFEDVKMVGPRKNGKTDSQAWYYIIQEE
jgi:hypothetical protein